MFQKDFLKKTIDKETQCNYINEYKLIRNFDENLIMVSTDFSKSIKEYILHLLNLILIKNSIQPYHITLLDIRKINFFNSYKINFSIYNNSKKNLNLMNEIVAFKENIIIQGFKSLLPIYQEKYFAKNSIFLSIYLIPCFEKNKSIFELFKINKKYIISVLGKDILTKYPLNQIKYLGFLSDNKNQTFGIIGLPNKKICKIMLGSYLGIEQALVIGIYPEKIIITDKKSNKIIVHRIYTEINL